MSELSYDIEAYQEDFPAFARDHLLIQTKRGTLEPFVLNRAQMHAWREIKAARDAGRPVRMYILKSRQMGFSTLIQGLAYWNSVLWPNHNGFVVAHALDQAAMLFDKSRIFYVNMDARVRPMRKLSNRKEMHFANPKTRLEPEDDPGLESRIVVDTADNKNLGVSMTLHFLHLSEFARYEQIRSDARMIFPIMLQSVPRESDTYVFIETTAFGIGFGKEYWDNDNGFTKLFFSWVADDRYRVDEPLEAEELSDAEDTDWGNELVALELVLEELERWYPELGTPEARMHEALCRLAWRRLVLSQDFNHDVDLFRQEYPLFPEEAFVTSGASVFDGKKISDIRSALYSRDENGVRGPLLLEPSRKRYDREFERFFDARHGTLSIYEEPKENQLYCVGVDVGEGIADGDYSAAQVLSLPSLKQVAVYRERISPDDLADVVFRLGAYYNWAKVTVETNAAGFATNLRLTKALFYPNLYWREVLDSISKQIITKSGWNTNKASKNVLVTDLRAALDNDLILFLDPETLDEMSTFVQHKDGKIGAVQGKKDDLVMSLGIALQGAYQAGFRRLGKGESLTQQIEEKRDPSEIVGTYAWWEKLALNHGLARRNEQY